jgi:hypothetical protein
MSQIDQSFDFPRTPIAVVDCGATGEALLKRAPLESMGAAVTSNLKLPRHTSTLHFSDLARCPTLSPYCAAKRTSANDSELWVHALDQVFVFLTAF